MRASFASAAAACVLAGIASAKPSSIAAAEVRSLRAGTDHLPVKTIIAGFGFVMPLSSGGLYGFNCVATLCARVWA
jgi:hypothetical protein